MKVVWLASYPKSGNTWVRFLFTHLLHGPFDHSQTIFDVTPVLERGIDQATLSADRPNMIKTHNKLSANLPMLPETAGAIYIVRDPLDVMMSNMNYFLLSTSQVGSMDQDQVNQTATDYLKTYLAHGGDPRWQKVNYGTWREHVESWTENSLGIPVKVIRYEDLLSDTEANLREAADFAGVDISDEKLATAVELSSFDNMRAMEEREIREQRPGMFFSPDRTASNARGFRFMNKGKKNTAKEMLGPDVIRDARAVFAPHVDQLGYAQ